MCEGWIPEYKASPDSSKAAYWIYEKQGTGGRPYGHLAIFIPTKAGWKAVSVVVISARWPYTAEFAWNPNSTRLTYHSSHAGYFGTWYQQGNPELYVADLATRRVIQITNNPGEDYGVVWLDSDRFQYCEEGGYPKYETYVINWDGTGKQKLHDGCTEQR